MTDAGWQSLSPGELLHVDANLTVHSTIALDEPPADSLGLADLSADAAASQTATHLPDERR
jgi:glutamine amidotransferase